MTSFPLSSLQQVVYVSVLNAVQLTKTPSDTVHGFVPVCVTMTSKLIFKLRHWIFRCGHVCIFLFIVDKSYLVRNYMHVNKHAIWSKKCVVLFVRESKFMQICAVWNVPVFVSNRNFVEHSSVVMAESQRCRCCCGLQAVRTKQNHPRAGSHLLKWHILQCILTALELNCISASIVNHFVMRGSKYFSHIYKHLFHYRGAQTFSLRWQKNRNVMVSHGPKVKTPISLCCIVLYCIVLLRSKIERGSKVPFTDLLCKMSLCPKCSDYTK